MRDVFPAEVHHVQCSYRLGFRRSEHAMINDKEHMLGHYVAHAR